jgi:hypothetical protein
MSDLDRFMAQSGAVARRLLNALTREFQRLGCDAYVKTIYIGWQVEGRLVAAVYPHSSRVEIAIALPEDHHSPLLKDATHLTWRSLPVALDVSQGDDVRPVIALIEEAVTRVRSGQHDTDLPVERFMGRQRRIADRTLLSPAKRTRKGPPA